MLLCLDSTITLNACKVDRQVDFDVVDDSPCCLSSLNHPKSLLQFDMIVIIDHFLRMEDLSLNRNDKYCKVEHKLEMLAQSKLQNLNATTLRRIEDRILAL